LRHLFFSSLLANNGRYVPASADPQHAPAVIQYTGGTTGLPKGTVRTAIDGRVPLGPTHIDHRQDPQA
jgi:acyl-coenzyme A synthetase/AMP-(fatty) acid ligase